LSAIAGYDDAPPQSLRGGNEAGMRKGSTPTAVAVLYARQEGVPCRLARPVRRPTAARGSVPHVNRRLERRRTAMMTYDVPESVHTHTGHPARRVASVEMSPP